MSADSAANDDQGMSQADIDAALAGGAGLTSDASAAPAPGAERADSPADSSESKPSQPASEGLSQVDIDAAFGGVAAASSPPTTPPVAGRESSAPPTDDSSSKNKLAAEGLSQADIDAAISGVAPAAAERSAAPSHDSSLAVAADKPTNSEGRPFDAAAAAMAEAIAEQKAAAAAAIAAPPVQAAPFELPDLEAMAQDAGRRQGIELLHDVNLRVTVELGRTRMAVEDVLKLDDGSIVELDKLAGDPVDVMVNGRLVARGEVLVLNDTFSVRISEVISAREQTAASA